MNESESPRVVFDCMIYLQATTRPDGPAAECLRCAEQHRACLLISDEVLTEVADVLARPKIRAKNPRLTDESVEKYLNRIRQISESISDVASHFSLPRDPNDEPYLNLAITGHATIIVSRDRDLLDLTVINSDEAIEFRSRFPHIDILEPIEFLKLIRGNAE